MHLSEHEVLIGKFKHAAYKPCYWTEQSLRTGGRRHCYKHGFGIKSHLCIQSTSFRGCNIACSFCWRDVEGRQYSFQKIDDPDLIADELISEQSAIIERHLSFALDNFDNMVKIVHALGSDGESLSVRELAEICGISRQRAEDAIIDLKNARVVKQIDCGRGLEKKFALEQGISSITRAELSLERSREIVEQFVATRKDIIDVHIEATKPKHVAISYDGEPTMYSRLGELIHEFRKRGISTFLVTNGTFPERIARLKETGCLPTQLYVTLAAPDKETYLRVCSSVKPYFPVHEDHWERLNKTLGLLSEIGCRTVIRITSVKGVNMINPLGYRELVKKSNPSFLEVKGFSISGNAPRISERLGETDLGKDSPELMRIALKYSPTHQEILKFSKQISEDFRIFPMVSQSELNRQVLMAVAWKDPSRVEIDFSKEL